MKTLILVFALLVGASKSVYDFKVTSIDGTAINLQKFKGKKILIVVTASKSAFSAQYKELQKLSQQYKNKLVVIGFPTNSFGKQEPGTNAEIKKLCEKNYGVTFLLSQKVNVKGTDISPLFKYLTTAENHEQIKGDITWNFEKFLIDENGKLIHRFPSAVFPLSPEITRFI